MRITLKEAYHPDHQAGSEVNTALREHAFNVLPELVQALDAVSVWLIAPSLDKKTLDDMRSITSTAIAKASTVEVPQ